MKAFYVFATWLDVLAISVCVGFAACGAWVVRRSGPGGGFAVLWRWLGAAAALLTLSSGVLLVSRTLEMSGAPPGALPGLVLLVLRKTHYGGLWLVRLGALGALWLTWALGHGRKWRGPATGVVFLAVAVVSFTRSATSHAGGHGDYTLAVWADVLHLLSVGAWVGTLIAMSVAVFPRLRESSRSGRAAVVDVFSRLSTLSGIALLIIVVTGIYNADKGLGHPSALWQSRYGLILIAKLILVGLMVCIGAYNRYVKLPRLQKWAGQGGATRHLLPRLPGFPRVVARAVNASDPNPVRGCARAVAAETLLALGALLAAALLHHTIPPADIPHSRTTALDQTGSRHLSANIRSLGAPAIPRVSSLAAKRTMFNEPAAEIISLPDWAKSLKKFPGKDRIVRLSREHPGSMP